MESGGQFEVHGEPIETSLQVDSSCSQSVISSPFGGYTKGTTTSTIRQPPFLQQLPSHFSTGKMKS